ncbi:MULTISPECIES: L-aspartate oxidase [unclassified Leifsonia]|uniref:L-aspartate oxidase n=1 Tax=unclassified Leifsonia TaxID=2663824 RepID=UPI0006F439C1|nr:MULTISPECIES: L-aspartate oxidase [unclassified Leifsonia]KQX07419.1 L-aspartate oxidase [Leifsonia sp. Root1293]KRA11701.1 L-aspartate oxidase [Leifsonia sp. Root60]
MHVLVIGSGLAGLFAAVRATDAGHAVTLVTKGALAESNTAYAQGGIAAALFPDDSADAHLLDTLSAGDGLCDVDAARVLVEEGPARVRDLIRFGVAFDGDASGSGLARGLEAAHRRARVLHAGGDATGSAIERALISTVRQRAAVVHEYTMLVDLLTDAGTVVGALVQGPAGIGPQPLSRWEIRADAVILATGGAGQLYRHTTNPAVATGDGAAAAWRAGARMADLEFLQFHPTALAVPGTPLVSEAVRGEGAVLRNAHGERFMLDVHPLAELAPRDVVARAIAVEMAAQGGEPVLLDATAIGRGALEARFPTITAACRATGYDWAVQPVPVSPAAHYWMGGVATDSWGRTSLAGLHAVGEVACTGVHGANRLASNSLLEAAVFADRAVRDLGTASDVTPPGKRGLSEPEVPSSHAPDGVSAEISSLSSPDAGLRRSVQALLWEHAGVLRSGDGLRQARDALAALSRPDTAATRTGSVLEDANLLDLARLIVDAALAREESRGAHFRTDFPVANPQLAVRAPLREDSLAC